MKFSGRPRKHPLQASIPINSISVTASGSQSEKEAEHQLQSVAVGQPQNEASCQFQTEAEGQDQNETKEINVHVIKIEEDHKAPEETKDSNETGKLSGVVRKPVCGVFDQA